MNYAEICAHLDVEGIASFQTGDTTNFYFAYLCLKKYLSAEVFLNFPCFIFALHRTFIGVSRKKLIVLYYATF
jgi:hypothetical protein